MKSLIIGLDTIPFTMIDNYLIYKVDNVKSIHFVHGNHSHIKWNEYEITIEDESNGEHNNYFNLTCLMHDAFSHWTLEVAIFLGLYKQLKEQIPNLKLYMPHFRHYKMSCLNAFGIGIESTADTIQSNNTCFFTERISHNDPIFNENYKTYLSNFTNYFHSNIGNLEKDIDLIYMPRGRRENANGRRIDNEDKIELLLRDKYKCIVYNTDNASDNFIDQVKLINRAKVVVLTYGSAFFVNGCMLKNCKIIVLEKIESQFEYPYMRFIYNYILENNTVEFIVGDNLHDLNYINNIVSSMIFE